MLMIIVGFVTLHGLVFLPVLLSFIGEDNVITLFMLFILLHTPQVILKIKVQLIPNLL